MLPEVVIRTVFKYVHPIDLIGGVSKCCRRWNRLATIGAVYRDLRVIIVDQHSSSSARRFLDKASAHANSN